MRRRELLGLLGGAAAAWPLAARAQQADRVRQIGILMASTAEDDPVQQALVVGFRQELEKLGWADGRNARIVGRFAAGNVDRVRRYQRNW